VPIDQLRIDQFAECTGDHQWIHVDPERSARESPFGGPIAHGFLTLSLIGAAVMDSGAIPAGVSRVINAGVNNVRFKSPVRVNKRVRTRMTLASVEPKGDSRQLMVLRAQLEIEEEAEPALTADVTLMLFK
jgi:acyl dehydratase